jgi:hypothetical protein
LDFKAPIVIPYYFNLRDTSDFIKSVKLLKAVDGIILLNFTKDYQIDLSDSSAGIKQINFSENFGPRYPFYSKKLRRVLPKYYLVSDPDIEISPTLPDTFLKTFISISKTYKVGKVGSALDISSSDVDLTRRVIVNEKSYTLLEWESQFWKNPIPQNFVDADIYHAQIDSTFCLVNQDFLGTNHNLTAIRVAGKYQVGHKPWSRNYLIDLNYEHNSAASFWRRKDKINDSYYLNETIHLLKIEVDNLEFELVKLRLIQNRIENSKSWRYTKILRMLSKLVRKLKGFDNYSAPEGI